MTPKETIEFLNLIERRDYFEIAKRIVQADIERIRKQDDEAQHERQRPTD